MLLIGKVVASNTPMAIICDQTYALCTSAACIPDPVNSKNAICDCEVYQGKSAGYNSCSQRKPYLDQYKVMHVISTFSFEQFATKKSMTCPQGFLWTDCVDHSCTVDPKNKQRALCNCKIHSSKSFITFGGECNQQNCKTGFWSGATESTSKGLRQALMKEITVPSKAQCKR